MGKSKERIKGLKINAGDMPITTALRKFKQLVDDSGKIEEYKKKMYFEKPTTEKKRKKGAARARWLKRLQEQQLPKKMY